MDGPWTRFATTHDADAGDAGAPWARYQQSMPQAQPDASEFAPDDPGFGGSMMIGAGKTVDRIGRGMQQLYYGTKTAFDPKDAASQRELDRLRADTAEEDRLYRPLRDARPWATGLGEALPGMAIPLGGGAGLLATTGKAALAGATPGLLEYGSADERLTRGAIGAAAGAALPAGIAAFKTVKALGEPLWTGGRERIVGRTLNRVAGLDADWVRNNLAVASELVPGSKPTAAQVARSGGIAALERSIAAAHPQAYTERAMEQASARLNALRSIAGDEAKMAAAVAKRTADKTADYAAADVGIAPVDRYFQGLMQRPPFATAVKRAQTLARSGGLDDIFFRDAQGRPTGLIGEGAHFIKKALDEAAEPGSKSYTGKTAARLAGDTNRLFQDWLEQSVPAYRVARDRFAANSRPINQMQIGQDLLNRVQPALADYGQLGVEQAVQYARALRGADATAASATGMSGARMADVLDPRQMATVKSVAHDLARKVNAQNLGRNVGSDTFQKLAMQNIAEQSGMPRLTRGLLSLPAVSRGTSWVYRDTDEMMQTLMAEALLNPRRAAQLMHRAAPDLPPGLLAPVTARLGLLGAPVAQRAAAE